MSFPAFIDTCALYSATLTDTLLRIAEERAFRPHWSAGVMTELASVLVREAGLKREQAARRIAQMQRAFPAAEVIEYEPLIEVMSCDQKDRHVLAAAVHGGCEVLVTFNLKDFPPESTEPFHVTVVSPDAFLLDQLDLYPAKVGRALLAQLTAAKRPPLTMGQLLGRLARAGVPGFAAETRRHEFA
ncbi:PIN domain-containing protein [Jiangella alkaliphila]|uniref:Predicted nucleic acid-binding protein, contains PIN domain n=1 Tax=Jiangella alkaliphila TaxID=419479 RepID=A0A1H2HFA8_9ACTN|nr:PIN domain-containing protein [Jiangella alkaliphila]SDU30577.1 Predicted nucleic acid-binding protein, contains PIN domain [Jiangella alkaliphila]